MRVFFIEVSVRFKKLSERGAMIPLGPVVARSKARVARADVWEYFVDAERRKTWWPELQLEPRVGGAVSERWAETSGDGEISRDASGEVDVLVDGHAIGFRWSEADDENSTAVLVTLRSSGPDTGITVTETGFDALSAPAESAAASQEGWQVLLGDLVAAIQAAIASGELVENGVTAAQEPVEEVAENEEPAETVAEEAADAEGAEELEPVVEDDTAELEVPVAEAAEIVEPEENAEPEEAADPEPEDAAEPEPEAEDDEDFPEDPNFDDLIRGPQNS